MRGKWNLLILPTRKDKMKAITIREERTIMTRTITIREERTIITRTIMISEERTIMIKEKSTIIIEIHDPICNDFFSFWLRQALIFKQLSLSAYSVKS